MKRPMLAAALAAHFLLACGQAEPTADKKPAAGEKPAAAAPAAPFLAGSDLKGWKVLEQMKDHGAVTMKDGVLSLGAGKPMTAVVYEGARELPVKDYEISLEARRVKGEDAFAFITLPVRDKKTCVTLVIGGWHGKAVGISNIEGMDASENGSSSWVEFENDKWYKIRLQVRENGFVCHIDGKQVFEVDTEGKKLGMRFGDIEFCQPFGLATYDTTGEIKNLDIRPLPQKP